MPAPLLKIPAKRGSTVQEHTARTVPDTEATLVPGVTTTTSQCAAFKVDLPLFQILAAPGNGNLYLFAKVDDATVVPTFAQSCITWQE